MTANDLKNVRLIRKGIGGASGLRTIYLGVTSQHSSMIYRGSPLLVLGSYESGDPVPPEYTRRIARHPRIIVPGVCPRAWLRIMRP